MFRLFLIVWVCAAVFTTILALPPISDAVSVSQPATTSGNDEPTSPLAGGRNQHIVENSETVSDAEPSGAEREPFPIFPLPFVPHDIVRDNVFTRLPNKKRLAVMASSNRQDFETLVARFQALRPSTPMPLPADCPPTVADALMPENSVHLNIANIHVLPLAFSPRVAHPLSRRCLQALVAEFQRPDSLLSHIQTLHVEWDSKGRRPLVDVPTSDGLLSEIQVLLNNPPPSLTTLSISSDLLTSISVGRMRRLVLDLKRWDQADPVDSFLRAGAPHITSLVLKWCKTSFPLMIVLSALENAVLEALTIDWPGKRIHWPLLWDLSFDSLSHLRHFKFRHGSDNVHENMRGLWRRVICHPGLVSFEVNWQHELGDLDLRHTTQCLVNNPGLRKFVASQIGYWSSDTWNLQSYEDLKSYFAAVANHPALEEWSAPAFIMDIVRDRRLPSRQSEVPSRQIEALRELITSFHFSRLRTLWWSCPTDWPDSFPNVKKLVVPAGFLSLVANTEMIHALPPALEELEVAGPSFARLDWDPEPAPAWPRLCQVQAFVYSVYSEPADSPSILLSSLTPIKSLDANLNALVLFDLQSFVRFLERVMSPQTVNSFPSRDFNDLVPEDRLGGVPLDM